MSGVSHQTSAADAVPVATHAGVDVGSSEPMARRGGPSANRISGALSAVRASRWSHPARPTTLTAL